MAHATAALKRALTVGATDVPAALAQLELLAGLSVDAAAFAAFAAPLTECVGTLKMIRKFPDAAVAARSGDIYGRWKAAVAGPAAAAEPVAA